MWFTLSSHFGVAYFQTCLCQNFVAGSKIAVCRFNAPKTAKVLGPPKTLPNRYMSTVTVTSSNNIPIKPHIQSQKMFGAVGPMFFHIFALAPWHVCPLKIPGFTSSPSDFCKDPAEHSQIGSIQQVLRYIGLVTVGHWTVRMDLASCSYLFISDPVRVFAWNPQGTDGSLNGWLCLYEWVYLAIRVAADLYAKFSQRFIYSSHLPPPTNTDPAMSWGFEDDFPLLFSGSNCFNSDGKTVEGTDFPPWLYC
jgi:hypothetical protein